MDVALWIALVAALLGSDNAGRMVDPAKGGPAGSRQVLAVAAGMGALGVATAGVVAYGVYVKFGKGNADLSVFNPLTHGPLAAKPAATDATVPADTPVIMPLPPETPPSPAGTPPPAQPLPGGDAPVAPAP